MNKNCCYEIYSPMQKNKKIIIALGLIILSILLVGVIITLTRPKASVSTTSKTSKLAESQIDSEVIPTVGPEVKVKIVSIDPKKVVKLVVDGVPSNTTSLEYEFIYSTSEQDSEGVFSTAKPKEGLKSFPKTFEREITLGTCSRNVCRYHVITSKITIRLKFEGDYGSRLYQKDFDSSIL